MTILAIEASTARPTVALLRGDDCSTAPYDNREGTAPLLLDALHDLLDRTGIALTDIEALACGLGPGSFSGLRAALAVLHGLALPDNTPIHGLSSASVIACDASKALSPAPSRVCVLGDARRQLLWNGLFDTSDEIPRRDRDWILAGADETPAHVPADALVVSPDADAIAPVLDALERHGRCVRKEPAVADACSLARLAARRMLAGMPSEPLRPIYLHPAVGPSISTTADKHAEMSSAGGDTP